MAFWQTELDFARELAIVPSKHGTAQIDDAVNLQNLIPSEGARVLYFNFVI
jgi:hypothetical protein